LKRGRRNEVRSTAERFGYVNYVMLWTADCTLFCCVWSVCIGTSETLQVVNRYKGANYPIMNLHERVLSVLTNRASVLYSIYFVDVILLNS